MVGSRTVTAAVGVAVSLAISAAVWYYTNSLVLFLFVPFVPLLFRGWAGGTRRGRPPVRECPRCGFATRDPAFEYCPRDGTRLRA